MRFHQTQKYSDIRRVLLYDSEVKASQIEVWLEMDELTNQFDIMELRSEY